MKTVFMGTPDFAAEVLKALYDSDNEVAMVFTQPDRAKDRGKKIQFTPVKELALVHGTAVYQPEKLRTDQAVMEELKKVSPDIIVVAAYGQILPEEVLKLPKHGCINVHASLLPKLRGASPIQMAIVTGEEETGVTIMQMEKGLDTGDMLSAESIAIGDMTAGQLHDRLAQIGGRLLIRTIKDISEGKASPVKQDDSKATYAGLISKKDGKIDFSKSPQEIERLIRGFDPWPGAFCFLDGQQIKLWKAVPCGEKTSAEDGEVISAGNEGLKIACGGDSLMITELQAPGKKRMNAGDYLRGHAVKPGTVLK
ncbi:MAG: methionyl-tRNA formyltransferase [Anaerovoracaceae bacterium]